MSRIAYRCNNCQHTSEHPVDVSYRYCPKCGRFESETPDNGTSRPEDTYCGKCDVFGHAEASPACEFYYERWERNHADDD